MSIDEARILIQNTLKAERGVTDVSFTPLSHGVEMVSFHEQGHRAHFALCVDEYADNADLLEAHINGLAATALDAAKDKAALKRAKAAEEAAKQVRVNG